MMNAKHLSRNVPTGTYREVIRVSAPIVISMLSYTFMGVADTFLVAKLGTQAVAAVGLGAVAVFTVISLGWGVLNGVKVAVSQAHGAGEDERTKKLAYTGLCLAAGLSLTALVVFPFRQDILRYMGGQGSILRMSEQYLTWRLFGVLPMFLSIAAFGYFQGRGDTQTPMRVQVFANIVNVVLDVVLIFGLGPFPKMGVAGAAAATVFALTLQGAISLWLLGRHASLAGRPAWGDVNAIVKFGLPMGTRFFLDVLGWAFFTGIVARFGDAHLAAHTIVVRIISISFLPGFGIGEAASILTGQAVGAKSPNVARLVTRKATQIGIVAMGLGGVSFLLFGTEIVGLFQPASDVLELGGELMVIAALFQIFDSVVLVKTGALNGAGDTRYVMWIAIASSWLVLIPLGYFLCTVLGLGAPGAWWALTTQILLLAIATAWRWNSGRVKSIGPRILVASH